MSDEKMVTRHSVYEEMLAAAHAGAKLARNTLEKGEQAYAVQSAISLLQASREVLLITPPGGMVGATTQSGLHVYFMVREGVTPEQLRKALGDLLEEGITA